MLSFKVECLLIIFNLCILGILGKSKKTDMHFYKRSIQEKISRECRVEDCSHYQQCILYCYETLPSLTLFPCIETNIIYIIICKFLELSCLLSACPHVFLVVAVCINLVSFWNANFFTLLYSIN